MKRNLLLKERLQGLRKERGLTLADVEAGTGIPKSTLQRLEVDSPDLNAHETRVGYQDIVTLAKFYDVSADYLVGLTENLRHSNLAIDKLRLSDEAVEILKNGKLNNRLISEFLSHEDFPNLLSAMEIYIDRKILPQINTVNTIYKAAESSIREHFAVSENDEVMAFLQQSVIDEDEYLRYRISERFNAVMKSLFDAHKKDPLSVEQTEVMTEIKENIQTYMTTKSETASESRSRLVLLAKQIGLNIKDLTDEEIQAVVKALEKSEKYRQGKKRKR